LASTYALYVFTLSTMIIIIAVVSGAAALSVIVWVIYNETPSGGWAAITDNQLSSDKGATRKIGTNGPVIAKSEQSGAAKSQLFWIMISNYQIIETFLIIEAYMHESFVELLESINFLTFNLNFIPIGFVKDYQSNIEYATDPNKDSLLEKQMENAGFESKLFIADYLYFFIFFGVFIIMHIIFKAFINVPEHPVTKLERLVSAMHRYFTYDTYLRLMFATYLFVNVAVYYEYSRTQKTATQVISVIVGTI